VILAMAGIVVCSGCGGGTFRSNPQNPIQSTVTVVGTSGAIQQTTSFTLTIK